jgi:hypothetical protein
MGKRSTMKRFDVNVTYKFILAVSAEIEKFESAKVQPKQFSSEFLKEVEDEKKRLEQQKVEHQKKNRRELVKKAERKIENLDKHAFGDEEDLRLRLELLKMVSK